MRSTEERVASVRRRAHGESLKSRSLRVVGACSLVCLLLALGVLGSGVTVSSSPTQGLYGASILGDAVGGYVLVALVSFVAATALTLACLQHRAQRKGEHPPIGQDAIPKANDDPSSDSASTTKEG